MPITPENQAITPSLPLSTEVFTAPTATGEGETATYVSQLRGPGGAIIANTDFTAITCTFIDETTKIPINGRVDQDILGAGMTGQNNFTFSATALLTWNLQAADNTVVDPTGTVKIEFHRAILTFDFDIGSGPERAIHEVRIPVRRAFSTALPTVS